MIRRRRKKVLTPAEYVTQQGVHCPMCHSARIEGGEFEETETGAIQYIHCTVCGATWRDILGLVGYDSLAKPETRQFTVLIEGNCESAARQAGYDALFRKGVTVATVEAASQSDAEQMMSRLGEVRQVVLHGA
jgi:hypothetical protein